jgi:hypothetical protein
VVLVTFFTIICILPYLLAVRSPTSGGAAGAGGVGQGWCAVSYTWWLQWLLVEDQTQAAGGAGGAGGALGAAWYCKGSAGGNGSGTAISLPINGPNKRSDSSVKRGAASGLLYIMAIAMCH